MAERPQRYLPRVLDASQSVPQLELEPIELVDAEACKAVPAHALHRRHAPVKGDDLGAQLQADLLELQLQLFARGARPLAPGDPLRGRRLLLFELLADGAPAAEIDDVDGPGEAVVLDAAELQQTLAVTVPP